MSLRDRIAHWFGFDVQIHDLRERLADQREIAASLRAEIAELKADNAMMRLTLMPLSSAAGAAYVQRATAPPKDVDRTERAKDADWQSALTKLLEEEDSGVHGERREEVRQPAPHDEPRTQHGSEVVSGRS